jgi:general secretion pathway protein F/type IV pilus assembly protein PilC
MPTFSYKAVNQTGDRVEGTLVADNQHAALGQLNDQALFPVEVVEGGQAGRATMSGGRRRVKGRHLATFYGQLADLLKAGVPVLRALDVLSKQSNNAVLSEVVREIREDVAGGVALADAMTKHPHVFNELHIAMVTAGEHGGFLEDVLARVAHFTERADELKNKLIGSMIYPAILMFIGTALITALMTMVVPKLRPFLEADDNNLLTRFVFYSTDLLQDFGLWILAVIFGSVILCTYYVQSDAGRQRLDYLKLKLPVLGPTLVMISLCRFCRILGTMLNSGVPILSALKISRASAGNEIIAAEIDKAADSVQHGGTISEPLAASEFFPIDVVDMIAVAEEANNLESVLVQVAETNEIRTARMIDMGVRLVEPLLLVMMAGIIAVIAIALLVPILTMSSRM